MNSEPIQQEGCDFMAAAFEVYNHMGHGFTEDIHQESLEWELADRTIPYVAQAELTVSYKGRPLKRKFKPDLMVFGDVVVDLKAAIALPAEHEAQLLNCVKATGKPVGCLVNFGNREKLEWKRFARTRKISVN